MQIATIARIPIRLHWSFWGLMAFYALQALFSGGLGALVSSVSLLAVLFGSVVLHELGHALAARSFGIRTAHITLYPFGGIAALLDMPRTPRQELVVALAGPAVNFVLAAGFGVLWILTGLGWGLPAILVGINLVMGLFNLVPAFPMDGGRVLRALLAQRMGWRRGSELAMKVGRVFAWGFIGIGVLSWTPSLLLVGGFLLIALRAERARLAWATRGPLRGGVRWADPPRTTHHAPSVTWRLNPPRP